MSTKRQRRCAAITRHEENLIRIFGLKSPRTGLYQRLRYLETQARNLATALSNGDVSEDDAYVSNRRTFIREQLIKQLGTYALDRVFMDGDPRGPQLKIVLKEGEELARDMGGYGLIAPNLWEG